jgi:DNA end-binding protein Ku
LEDGMAAQGIWSGTISFSLVAIPVRVIPAVKPGRISFHLLHTKEFSRLSRKMFCPRDGAVVGPGEIVRGYELAPDKYVLMTDEELESVSPERSRTIEVLEFVDLKELDPVYYDRPYYLVPSKGGEKAYQLLAEVMRRSKKAGIAKFVLSEREYLVAIRSRGLALELVTLHYRDEVLSDDDMAPKAGAIEKDARDRMKQGIGRMIGGFSPEKYADGRRGKIMELLAAKAEKQKPVEAPTPAEDEGEGPPDLVAALEESMRKVKARENP